MESDHEMEIDDQEISENLILTPSPIINQPLPHIAPLSQPPNFGILPQQPAPNSSQLFGLPSNPSPASGISLATTNSSTPPFPSTPFGSPNISGVGIGYGMGPPNLFNQPHYPPSRIQNSDFVVYSSSLVLNNDEDFELKVVNKIKNESQDPVTVKIQNHPSKLKLSNTPVELICSLSLLGISAEIEEIEQNREGIDLVFVVDISGSMGSGKIDLVKVTIEFVLTILKEFDRVCIIGFSDSAFIYCPLTKMNEDGKLKVGEIVRRLGPTGGTNIESGVRAGLHILADRKKVNQITSIMLLSDGVDNDTRTVNHRVSAAIGEFTSKINGPFKLHTYGYGTDHDSVVMNLLAEQTRGNFYFIEREESVAEAFSNCMGELVSLVASKIHVSLNTLNCSVKFKLSQVYSKNEDVSFDMPDLFFDDQIDTVFILKFDPSEDSHANEVIQPIRAIVSYIQKGGEKVDKEVILSVEIIGEDSEPTINKEVLLEYYRVKGALVLKEVTKLADTENFEQARNIAKAFEEVLATCEVNDNKKIQFLLNDIKDSQNRTQSHNTWNSGGRAQVTSLGNAHFSQQASNNCMMYQKPMQAMYSASSYNYARSAPPTMTTSLNTAPNYQISPQSFSQINHPSYPNSAQTLPVYGNPVMNNMPSGFPLTPPQFLVNSNQVPFPSIPQSAQLPGSALGPPGGIQVQQIPGMHLNRLPPPPPPPSRLPPGGPPDSSS